MNGDFIQLLTALDGMSPQLPNENRTAPHDVVDKFKLWCWWLLLPSFTVLISLALYHAYITPLSERGVVLAQSIVIIIMVLGLMIVVLEILPEVKLLKFKKYAFDSLKADAHRDCKYAQELQEFSIEVIEDVRCWLNVKCNRIDNRVHLFKGAFAIFSMIVAVVLTPNDTESTPILQWVIDTATLGWGMLLLWVSAGLAGIILGTFMSRFLRDRYLYQIEILDLAKRNKKPKIFVERNEFDETP